eukprot:g4333.t1
MQCCVGCLGRKGAVIAGGAIFCLGSALQSIACNLTMMISGRIIAGFSVGLLSGNAPVYTSEIAPPRLRGALVTGFQFAVTVGIMLAFLLALVLEDATEPLAEIYRQRELETDTGSWREFLSGNNGKLLGLGVAIQLLGQLAGMNVFMFDGPLIFSMIFQSDHAGRLFTVVAGVVNIFATIPVIFLVDRYGRTWLMKWSAIGPLVLSLL